MKRTFSKFLKTSLLCFIIYILLIIENISSITAQEIIAAIIISITVSLITCPLLIKEDSFHIPRISAILSIICFIPIYTKELIKANISMAKKDLSFRTDYSSAVVKIKTDLKSDYGLAMLANCITLTPGTITIDIVEENRVNYLYVHCINIDFEIEDDDEKIAEEIKGNFEPWIRRIFG